MQKRILQKHRKRKDTDTGKPLTAERNEYGFPNENQDPMSLNLVLDSISRCD